MKPGLSGFVFAKNAIKLDYCLELAARSLLPVVDELILCDSNSTDGTLDLMHSIPGARVINYDVENPVVGPLWCPTWRNFVREHCRHEMHIALDADEVLNDTKECRQSVRESSGLVCPRFFNFWRDGRTLLPDGCCEPDYVIKLAPSDKFCQYGDVYPGMDPDPIPINDPSIQVFHLGFLRKEESLREKCRIIHTAHWGSLDKRYEDGIKDGKKVHEIDWGWDKPLRRYEGDYPSGVLEWITERTL